MRYKIILTVTSGMKFRTFKSHVENEHLLNDFNEACSNFDVKKVKATR